MFFFISFLYFSKSSFFIFYHLPCFTDFFVLFIEYKTGNKNCQYNKYYIDNFRKNIDLIQGICNVLRKKIVHIMFLPLLDRENKEVR